MKEFINTLTRMRYTLLQKEATLHAPVEKNYEHAVYKQKKKEHAAKSRALSRQIDALTAAVDALEYRRKQCS